MKKLLIATTNSDKFKLTSALIKLSGFDGFEFFCLKDIDYSGDDVVESGEISERAKQKAQVCFKNVGGKFDFVVGIDDGIIIKNQIHENVKDYVPKIIKGECLADGEQVFIARAYHFVSSEGKEYHEVTKIPFIYKPADHEIEIKPHSYPLSQVFYALDYDVPVSAMNKLDEDAYTLKYSKPYLSEILKQIKTTD